MLESRTLLDNNAAALGKPDGFEPLWLAVGSDALIALASFSVAVALFLWVRRCDQADLRWTLYSLAGFVLLSGTVYALAVAKAWEPVYRFYDWAKILTAVAVVMAAGVAWWWLLRARPGPGPVQSAGHEPLPPINARPDELDYDAPMGPRAPGEARAAGRSHERREPRSAQIDTRDRLLGELAHELRAPLTPIRNAAFLLRESRSPEQVERAAGLIEDQVRHLARLIDDLSDVKRVVSGQIELCKRFVTAQDVAQAAVDAVRHSLEANGYRLSVSMPTAPLRIEVDPARLRQVLTQLMSNAASYTEAGAELILATAVQGEDVLFGVRSRGAHIEPSQCELLTGLFADRDPGRTQTDARLGLGLSVVRRLVALHGGTVTVHNTGSGQGSEFTVSLPATIRAPGSHAVPEGRALLSGLRILVVDDHRLSADSLREALSYEGAEAHAVYAGAKALTRAQELQPQVVLLDIGLPDLAGDDVARRLRAMPGNGGLKIIALTGFEETARGTAPFDHHLVKPVELPDLLRLLTSLAS